jgi:hypothetical protein
MTFEEYKQFYNDKNYLPNNQYINRQKQLSEVQLRRKYGDYQRGEYKKELQLIRQKEKQMNKIAIATEYQQKVNDVVKKAKLKNPHGEWFWSRLSSDQSVVVRIEMLKIPEFKIYDPCHIIPRSKSRKLSYEEKNIIIAPRAFHTYIDSLMNPFSEKHEFITKEEQNKIWIQIVGQDIWNWLQENK